MKALTSLEFWNNTVESEIWQEMDSDEKNDFYDNAKKYNIFVSQPFRPQMITKLFERFEKVFETHYKHKAYTVQVSFGDCNMYLSVNGLLVSTPTIPKTLNDFISECNRAGIELEWKEGVI